MEISTSKLYCCQVHLVVSTSYVINIKWRKLKIIAQVRVLDFNQGTRGINFHYCKVYNFQSLNLINFIQNAIMIGDCFSVFYMWSISFTKWSWRVSMLWWTFVLFANKRMHQRKSIWITDMRLRKHEHDSLWKSCEILQ